MKDLKLNIELQIKGFEVRIIEQELKIESLMKERANERKKRDRAAVDKRKQALEIHDENVEGINRDIDICNCKIQCYKDSVFGLNELLKLAK